MKYVVAILCAMVILLVCGAAGCGRTLNYERIGPDGVVERFSYRNDAFDTKAGKVAVSKDGAKVDVQLENLDSTNRALDLANKAVDALKGAKLP